MYDLGFECLSRLLAAQEHCRGLCTHPFSSPCILQTSSITQESCHLEKFLGTPAVVGNVIVNRRMSEDNWWTTLWGGGGAPPLKCDQDGVDFS